MITITGTFASLGTALCASRRTRVNIVPVPYRFRTVASRISGDPYPTLGRPWFHKNPFMFPALGPPPSTWMSYITSPSLTFLQPQSSPLDQRESFHHVLGFILPRHTPSLQIPVPTPVATRTLSPCSAAAPLSPTLPIPTLRSSSVERIFIAQGTVVLAALLNT